MGLRFAARKPVLPTARLPTILSDHIRARSTHLPHALTWSVPRCRRPTGVVVSNDHGIESTFGFVVVVKLLESVSTFLVVIALKAGAVMPGYLSTSLRTSSSTCQIAAAIAAITTAAAVTVIPVIAAAAALLPSYPPTFLPSRARHAYLTCGRRSTPMPCSPPTLLPSYRSPRHAYLTCRRRSTPMLCSAGTARCSSRASTSPTTKGARGWRQLLPKYPDPGNRSLPSIRQVSKYPCGSRWYGDKNNTT